MAGDKLSLLLFLAGTSLAGVTAALSTSGWRSRGLWAGALAFGVAAFAFFLADKGSPLASAVVSVWTFSPFIAVALYFILHGGRTEKIVPPTPRQAEPEPDPPVLNPAITAEYLNELVRGTTELETKRRIQGLAKQLARLKGEVIELEENYNGRIQARIGGLFVDTGHREFDVVRVLFDRDQTLALEVIKRGDWIEFTGEIEHTALRGRWQVINATFDGRADVPKPPRRKRAALKGP